jgi:hypothetical protein
MRFLLVSLAIVVTACGDNAQRCGAGTIDMQGTCDPVCGPGTSFDPTLETCIPDGTDICADGTMLDPTTGMCVVASTDCQDGTVLFEGRCVDPTRQLPIDLDEGTEPDGDNVIEASANPAGLVALKAIGDPNGFIIHGQIAPFRDANGDGQLDPDVDTYLVTVTAPALLHVTAQGVNGITAGFLGIAQVDVTDPLASWERYGMSFGGAISKRQVYLPEAGTYALAIADTRTLMQYSAGEPTDAAPGPGDYYVTIDQLALPAPTVFDNAMPPGAIAADSVVGFYTLAPGDEPTEVTLDMPDVETLAALVVADNGQVVAAGSGDPADAVTPGFQAGDVPLIVVDDVYDTANQPAPVTLTVTN